MSNAATNGSPDFNLQSLMDMFSGLQEHTEDIVRNAEQIEKTILDGLKYLKANPDKLTSAKVSILDAFKQLELDIDADGLTDKIQAQLEAAAKTVRDTVPEINLDVDVDDLLPEIKNWIPDDIPGLKPIKDLLGLLAVPGLSVKLKSANAPPSTDTMDHSAQGDSGNTTSNAGPVSPSSMEDAWESHLEGFISSIWKDSVEGCFNEIQKALESSEVMSQIEESFSEFERLLTSGEPVSQESLMNEAGQLALRIVPLGTPLLANIVEIIWDCLGDLIDRALIFTESDLPYTPAIESLLKLTGLQSRSPLSLPALLTAAPFTLINSAISDEDISFPGPFQATPEQSGYGVCQLVDGLAIAMSAVISERYEYEKNPDDSPTKSFVKIEGIDLLSVLVNAGAQALSKPEFDKEVKNDIDKTNEAIWVYQWFICVGVPFLFWIKNVYDNNNQKWNNYVLADEYTESDSYEPILDVVFESIHLVMFSVLLSLEVDADKEEQISATYLIDPMAVIVDSIAEIHSHRLEAGGIFPSRTCPGLKHRYNRTLDQLGNFIRKLDAPIHLKHMRQVAAVCKNAISLSERFNIDGDRVQPAISTFLDEWNKIEWGDQPPKLVSERNYKELVNAVKELKKSLALDLRGPTLRPDELKEEPKPQNTRTVLRVFGVSAFQLTYGVLYLIEPDKPAS